MLLEKSTAMLFEGDKRGLYGPIMANKRRALTPEEVADAARLRRIWQKKKKKGLTQESISAQCGWSSNSAFSQFVNGAVPLNLEATIKIARVLDVSLKDISPRFASLLPVADFSPQALKMAQLYEECPPSGQAELLLMVKRWIAGELADSKQTIKA